MLVSPVARTSSPLLEAASSCWTSPAEGSQCRSSVGCCAPFNGLGEWTGWLNSQCGVAHSAIRPLGRFGRFAKSIKRRTTPNGQLKTQHLNRGATPELDRAGQRVKQGSFLQSDLRRSKTQSRLQPATAVAKREYRPFRPGYVYKHLHRN